MKKTYDKSIQLRCLTCGSDCSFHTDKMTGVVTCLKCNRIYYGGYDELVNLNQRRIDEELQFTIEDVKKDLEKDLLNDLKGIGFKV